MSICLISSTFAYQWFFTHTGVQWAVPKPAPCLELVEVRIDNEALGSDRAAAAAAATTESEDRSCHPSAPPPPEAACPIQGLTRSTGKLFHPPPLLLLLSVFAGRHAFADGVKELWLTVYLHLWGMIWRGRWYYTYPVAVHSYKNPFPTRDNNVQSLDTD